jgi:Tol biopolymer transport system component
MRIAWSPDGRTLVYDRFQNENWDIYTVEVCEETTCDPRPRRLTSGLALDARPAWSPDGQQIVFLSTRTDQLEIFVMDTDGSQQRRLTQNSNASIEPPKWSPDGSQLLFVSIRPDNPDIFVMDSTCGDLPDGCEGHIRNLTQHPAVDSQPAWSPDGQWVAFTSRRDGDFEIYVVSAEGGEPRNLTNFPAEDRSPVWSPDGRTIAFQSNRDKLYSDEIYVLDVATGEQWRVTNSFGFSQSPVWSPG